MALNLKRLLNICLTEQQNTEITLIEELMYLDAAKVELTAKNALKPKRRQGFNANFHNYSRNKNVYSIAEQQFKQLLDKFGIYYTHEHKISCKDVRMRTYCYHMDFYLPELRLNLEIKPLFHWTYEIVAKRDQLREKLLKKYHIDTIDIKVFHFVRKKRLITQIDTENAFKVLKSLKNKPISKETLSFYL